MSRDVPRDSQDWLTNEQVGTMGHQQAGTGKVEVHRWTERGKIHVCAGIVFLLVAEARVHEVGWEMRSGGTAADLPAPSPRHEGSY